MLYSSAMHGLHLTADLHHCQCDAAWLTDAQRLGAACTQAVQAAGLPVFEYSAKQVKQAVVGKGNAAKTQVQHMVKILLNIQGEMQIDASDALGICVCHAHHQQTALRLQKGLGL